MSGTGQSTHPKVYPKVDVIIVGAGISGLVSAIKIQQKERSLQIRILEASSKVGGQIEETRMGEIGGKWITEEQQPIFELLQHLDVPMRRRVILSPNGTRCWDIDDGVLSIPARYELTRYLNELELKIPYFRPGHYNHSRNSQSMYSHICKKLFFNKSRKFMTNLVRLISGVNAQDISYIHFMGICSTCGGIQPLMEIYLECPSTLWEVSSRKLIQGLLDRLQNTEIICWRKVYEIRHFKEHVEVHDSDYFIHRADAVIMAIPWNCIEKIYILPSLPLELRKQSMLAYKNRMVVTSFIARYTEGFWRMDGHSGSFLCSEPMIMGHEYRPTVYSGMIVHEEGLEPLIQSMTLQILSGHFGEAMLLPIDYCQKTYELNTMNSIPFTTPWNRIVWSSSSMSATMYRGCLGGAVQSGLRAAMNALLVVRPQNVTWQDVAEAQGSDSLRKQYPGILSLWLSSFNLYNVTFYSLLTYGAVFTVRMFYRRQIQ